METFSSSTGLEYIKNIIKRIPALTDYSQYERNLKSISDNALDKLDESIKHAIFISLKKENLENFQKELNASNLSDSKKSKIAITLFKYLNRMRYRPTPYGLFAKYGVISNEDSNKEKILVSESIENLSNLILGFEMNQRLIQKNGDVSLFSFTNYDLANKIFHPKKNSYSHHHYLQIKSRILNDPQALKKPSTDILNSGMVIPILKNIFEPNTSSFTSELEQTSTTFDPSKKHDLTFNINDSFKAPISINTLKDIASAMATFIGPVNNSKFQGFKQLFVSKYGRSKVNLMEVLDPGRGLGYVEKELAFEQDSQIKNLIKNVRPTSSSKNQIDNYRIKDNIDIKNLYKTSKVNFPITFNLFTSSFKFEGQEKLFIKFIGGSGAKSLIGRYTLSNQDVYSIFKDISDFEIEKLSKKGMRIFKVLYFDNVNQLNVVPFRTSPNDYILNLSPFKINLDSCLIDFTNIFISYEENSNKLILIDEKNTPLIPDFPNALNPYAVESEVFQFLYDYRFSEVDENNFYSLYQSRYFDADMFIPRISYGEIILHPKTVKIKGINLQESNLLSHLDILKFPQQFFLVEGDTYLYFNLENTVSKKFFFEIIKKKKEIRLEESLGGPEVEVSENIYFIKNHEYSPNIKPSSVTNTSPDLKFQYISVYCNNNNQDPILNEVFEIIKHIGFSNFFFVRYFDENGGHVRIRFSMDKSANEQYEVVSYLKTKLLERLKVQDIYTFHESFYLPEYDKYPIEIIDHIHNIFTIDSIHYLEFKKNLENISDFYLYGVFKLLTYLKVFGNEKAFSNIRNMKESFQKRLNINEGYRKHLRTQYQEMDNYAAKFILKNHELFQKFSKDLVSEKNEITNSNNTLTEHSLLCLLHMSVNRIFSSNQLYKEFVIYDYILRREKKIMDVYPNE